MDNILRFNFKYFFDVFKQNKGQFSGVCFEMVYLNGQILPVVENNYSLLSTISIHVSTVEVIFPEGPAKKIK